MPLGAIPKGYCLLRYCGADEGEAIANASPLLITIPLSREFILVPEMQLRFSDDDPA
jgi:hypothetical protein